MAPQINLKAVGRGPGACLSPPSINLMELIPAEGPGGERLADE